MTNHHNLPKFQVKLDAVLTTYNGAVGCMCGCIGNYACTEAKREAAGQARGYSMDHEDGEVSDTKVKRRVSAINRMLRDETYDELDYCEQYVYVSRGGRCFAVYF